MSLHVTPADPLTDPEANHLHELLQSEYVGLYGEPDPNPYGGIEDCRDLQGRTLVGRIRIGGAVRPVALGAWHRLSTKERQEAGLAYAENVAGVRRVYVHYRHRRQGLASSIMEEVERSARECGMSHIVLETGTAQTSALALYRSRGYDDIPGYGYYRDAPDSVFLGRTL